MLRCAVLLGLVCVLGCRATVPIDENAVFAPRRALDAHTFDFANASYQEVPFQAADGTELYAWHIQREDAAHTVLYFGGQGFYLVLAHDFVADMLAHVPVNLFIVDYRGYGRSAGEPTVEALKSDALRAFQVLLDRGVPPEQILVHGHSMGSFVATHVSAEHDVAGLILESPVTEVEGWSKEVLPALARAFLKLEPSPALKAESNLERVAATTEPTLFLVGTDDPITPPALTEQLHDASAASQKRQVLIEGGGHNGLHTDPAFTDAYATFVASLPSPTQAAPTE